MNKKVIFVLIVAMVAAMYVGAAYAGAGDGTGPIGDQDPDRIHWICVDDPETGLTTCCPPLNPDCKVCTVEPTV